MLRSSPELDHVLDQIDSLLGQLKNPTLDKSLIQSLFAEVSLLFDEMIELRQDFKKTTLNK